MSALRKNKIQEVGKNFGTIAEGLAAAKIGDLVFVHPGQYKESNLVLKSGVNIYFAPGVELIQPDSELAAGTDFTLFTDNGVKVICQLDGFPRIIFNNSTDLIQLSKATSAVTVRGVWDYDHPGALGWSSSNVTRAQSQLLYGNGAPAATIPANQLYYDYTNHIIYLGGLTGLSDKFYSLVAMLGAYTIANLQTALGYFASVVAGTAKASRAAVLDAAKGIDISVLKHATSRLTGLTAGYLGIRPFNDGLNVRLEYASNKGGTERYNIISTLADLEAAIIGRHYSGTGTDQYLYIPNSTNLQFGTNDFGEQLFVALPDYTPAAAVTLSRKANTTDNLGRIWTLETDGKLQLAIGNGIDFTTLKYKSTVAINLTDGLWSELSYWYKRETATADGYVNFFQGETLLDTVVVSAGTPQTVTESTPSSEFLFLNIDGTTEYAFKLAHYRPWNMVLDATSPVDLAIIGGGAIPYKYKSANQTNLVVNGTFAADTDWTKQASWTIGDGVAHYDDVLNQYLTPSAAIPINGGKCYRIPFDISNIGGPIGASVVIATELGGRLLADIGALVYPEGTHVLEGIANPATNLRVYGDNAAGNSFDFDNFSVTAIGCVLELNASGIGSYSGVDDSGNGMHTINSGCQAVGVNIGDRQFASKKLIANTATTLTSIHPAKNSVVTIWAKATSAVTGFKIGTASGGGQIVASVSVGTTWQRLTLAATAWDVLSETAADTWYAEHATAGQTVQIMARFERALI